MLDTEYQQLLSEVDRIATDTEFAGQQLVNGSLTTAGNAIGATGNFSVSDGVASITGRGFSTSATGTPSYPKGFDGEPRIISRRSDTKSDTLNIGTLSYATVSGGGGKFTFAFNSVNYTGSISTGVLNSSNELTTGTSVKLTNSSNSNELVIALNTTFASDTNVSSSTNNSMYFTGSDTTSFRFKVGTGTDSSADVISVSVDSISASNLAINGTSISTASAADTALSLISRAIDTLNTARANVGAAQNRLEFAVANIATAIENQEAARSQLMDLDIAAEMVVFTSKQILVQAGVAMLVQANQSPQALLRLFR
jgi:flagellin